MVDILAPLAPHTHTQAYIHQYTHSLITHNHHHPHQHHLFNKISDTRTGFTEKKVIIRLVELNMGYLISLALLREVWLA
eukprot:m.69915 g.69915  ORF g.69915 m.69915 type:complete len:79 (+) comp8289_c1_seq1:186-422(+)